jgi:hypothetical protein
MASVFQKKIKTTFSRDFSEEGMPIISRELALGFILFKDISPSWVEK